ncbi:DUF5672 family protein [Flavitalea antarctica]
MNSVIVIIPIYKASPSLTDVSSFCRCIETLRKHPICLVCPEGLDISPYMLIADNNNKTVIVERFEKDFFSNIAGYNRLMLSIGFYKRFLAYNYLLVAQTDSYVFEDQLESWCGRGFDYIGAPWFEGWVGPNKKIIGAGNGGFSLRNVHKILKILHIISKLEFIINSIYSNHLLKRIPFKYISATLSLLYNVSRDGIAELVSFDYFAKKCKAFAYNEDYFFAKIVPGAFPNFIVADPSIAMFFSFENQPALLYEMTGKVLPFGCHGWEKYDPTFWSDFIKPSSKS